MDVKQMTVLELESYFNIVCKLRETTLLMARANNRLDSPELRKINVKYNLLYKEIMIRLDGLYESENEKKGVLNEEVVY